MNKHQTYRLGKTIFPFYAFFVMFAMTFASCRNNLTNAESIEPNQATTPSFSEAAKQWFESNKAMLSTTKYAKIEPRWNRIRDLGNRVELPYYIDSNVHLMTTRENAKPNQIGRSYMMLLKTKESYKIHFIDFIPADDFLGDLRTINSANFKSEKFTGYVIFRDDKGDVLTCHSYKEGKNRGKGTIITSDKNSFRATAGCQSGECTYEVIGHYRNGELTRISQNLLYCYCFENTDDSGGNDGDTDGGTGDDCTWCGGNNDCTTQECRCKENPNLPECGGCNCKNGEVVEALNRITFLPSDGYLLLNAHFTVSDCADPSYNLNVIPHRLSNSSGGSFEDEEYSGDLFISKTQIEPSDPKCGWSVTHRVYGSAVWVGQIANRDRRLKEYYNELVSPILK